MCTYQYSAILYVYRGLPFDYIRWNISREHLSILPRWYKLHTTFSKVSQTVKLLQDQSRLLLSVTWRFVLTEWKSVFVFLAITIGLLKRRRFAHKYTTLPNKGLWCVYNNNLWARNKLLGLYYWGADCRQLFFSIKIHVWLGYDKVLNTLTLAQFDQIKTENYLVY